MNIKFKKIKIKHTKLVFTFLIISLLLCILAYSFLFYTIYSKNEFVKSSLNIAKQNQVSIFRINKIMLYSSATAVDNSSNHSLQNLDIGQYTDIAIYIDNTSSISELTTQNTVKDLWIDNINITSSSELGNKFLNYKNVNNFGKFENLDKSTDRIDFNVINSNKDNDIADYSKPTFYTDCSNPISLSYSNLGLVKNYSIHDDVNSVIFNGKILKQANVDISTLDFNLKFDIHLKNYDDDSFIYHANIDIKLNNENKDILNGYSYEVRNNTSGAEYVFFKEIK